MVSGTHGLQHLHARKRLHQKHEKFPHPEKFRGFMDRALYIIGFLGIIMTLPQLIKVWGSQSAVGLSLVTWVFYLINAIFWMIYGVLHKEKVIMVSYSFWILVEFLIVLGIVIYG